jgi:hypothetical protein
MQKLNTFLYTRIEPSKKEVEKIGPFLIASTRIETNLSKDAKNLYIENCKISLIEIKEDTNKWKDISCSWILRFKIVKMSILLKVILKIQHNSNDILIEIEKPILKFLWKLKGP